MAVSEKKKRYAVTLYPSVVERFQALAKFFNMPQNAMSNVCNEAIMEITKTFQLAKDQGKLDIQDLFRLMGQQVELLIQEERKEAVKNAKKKTGKKEKARGK